MKYGGGLLFEVCVHNASFFGTAIVFQLLTDTNSWECNVHKVEIKRLPLIRIILKQKELEL